MRTLLLNYDKYCQAGRKDHSGYKMLNQYKRSFSVHEMPDKESGNHDGDNFSSS